MSGANEKTPWKEGYWGKDIENGGVWTVKGSDVIAQSMVGFVQDFEIDCTKGKWTFGEFGKVSKEMKNFTSISKAHRA